MGKLKSYTISVASSDLRNDFSSLGRDEWLKSASVGSYFFETKSKDVLQAFLESWSQRSDVIFDHETRTFIYSFANWRMMALDYQEVSPEMAVILRQCK